MSLERSGARADYPPKKKDDTVVDLEKFRKLRAQQEAWKKAQAKKERPGAPQSNEKPKPRPKVEKQPSKLMALRSVRNPELREKFFPAPPDYKPMSKREALVASGIDRRQLGMGLIGGLAAMFGGGAALTYGVQKVREQSRHPEVRRLTRAERLAEAPVFYREVVNYARERGTGVALQSIDRNSAVPVGETGLSRREYIAQHCMNPALTPHIPQAVRDELKFIIPGLVAQESQYVANARSHAGAVNMFQFTPGTWDAHTPFRRDQMPLIEYQVQGADHYFDYIARFLHRRAGNALNHIKHHYFDNDEDRFNRDFFALAIVNSYNSGEARLAHLIKWFAHRRPVVARGMDVYHTFSEDAFANRRSIPGRFLTGSEAGQRISAAYGPDSHTYVRKCYGYATIMQMIMDQDRALETPEASAPTTSH